MLREFEDVKQFAGEPQRRWFEDEYFDLIVWQDEGEEIIEFELSYDKSKNQRAIRWGKSAGFAHYRVDDGDSPGKHKARPVLFPDGDFDFGRIARLFASASKEVNGKITKFVLEKILQFTTSPDGSKNAATQNNNSQKQSTLKAFKNLIRKIWIPTNSS